MTSYRGHWRVQIVDVSWRPPLDKNGTYFGVQFTDGWKLVSWHDFADEHACEVAIQNLGSDDRFRVVEIPEREYMGDAKSTPTEFL